MTTDELKKEAKEYGIDLCAYCRECEGEKPCQHKLDAMHGYQDGLKAREKRIAELEKENVELKIKKIPELERKIASIRGCHRVDLVKLKARTEQVARLKKEKAELEQENLVLHKMNVKRIEYYNQLTKAKEIIKEFVHHYKAKTIYIENMKNLLEQAEQFLSEVKNEKHQRKEM